MPSPTITAPPTDEEGLRLHRALLRPGPTAPADFAAAYLPHLSAWLRANNARVDPDLCAEAAADAIQSILDRPERFDPNRGMSLLAYLHLSAHGDLKNRLAKEKRHRHVPLENDVELSGDGRKDQESGTEPWKLLADSEEEQRRRARVEAFRATLKEADRAAFDLLDAGESRTKAFVEVLGIAHLPRKEQEDEVKRLKDRVKVRLKRWWKRQR